MATPKFIRSKPQVAVVATLLVIAVFMVAGWVVRRALDTRGVVKPPVLPVLVVDADKLDFGETWDNRDFRWVLPIRNTSSQVVEISDFGTSCDCTKVSPRSLSIPAGATVAVEMQFNLLRAPDARSRSPAASTPLPASPKSLPLANEMSDVRDVQFAVTAFIGTGTAAAESARPQTVNWQLRGKVRSAIRLSHSAIFFGEHSDRYVQISVPEIEVIELTPLMTIETEVSDNSFVVERMERSVEDSSIFKIALTPRRQLPLGTFKFELSLVPRQPDGRRLPAVTVPVEGRVVTDVQPVPTAALLLGAHPVGTQIEEVVELASLTEQTFEIERVLTAPGTIATVQHQPGAKGKTCLLRQTILKTGEQKVVVEFIVKLPYGKTSQVSVVATYIGLAKQEPADATRGSQP